MVARISYHRVFIHNVFLLNQVSLGRSTRDSLAYEHAAHCEGSLHPLTRDRLCALLRAHFTSSVASSSVDYRVLLDDHLGTREFERLRRSDGCVSKNNLLPNPGVTEEVPLLLQSSLRLSPVHITTLVPFYDFYPLYCRS